MVRPAGNVRYKAYSIVDGRGATLPVLRELEGDDPYEVAIDVSNWYVKTFTIPIGRKYIVVIHRYVGIVYSGSIKLAFTIEPTFNLDGIIDLGEGGG